MPRVVCQVHTRTDRLTLIWSEGHASFAPYSIAGPALAELHRLSAEANERLARLGAAAGDDSKSAKAGMELAHTGHALYRLLFQLDQPEAHTSHEIRGWFDGLVRDGRVERLEIIGDAFALPWTAIYDHTPEPAAFAGKDGGGWKGFWNRQFTLLGGRRVQWLRGRQLPEKPNVVLALDPELRASLPEAEQRLLANFLSINDAPVAGSCGQLAAIFQSRDVDLLYIFGPASSNGVRLGKVQLSPEMLDAIVFGTGSEDGPSGQTVVFLNASTPTTGLSDSGYDLLTAFERFGGFGLIGTVQPLVAAQANRCGLELLSQLLSGGQTLAQALVGIRQKHPISGSLYFACCPGDVRPSTQLETTSNQESLPLPNNPYQPLAPLEENAGALLVGRDFDVAHVAAMLDENATRLVVVHGGLGVGKTSLLNAGVVPYLEDRAVGYHFLRQRAEGELAENELEYPVLSIRASSDLAGQLALALLDFCDHPYSYLTPTGKKNSVDLPAILGGMLPGSHDGAETLPTTEELRIALRHQPELFGRILAAATESLPFELVLLIDNGEDLFSPNHTSRTQRSAKRGLQILRAALAGPARVKFIVALGTEHIGRFLDLLAAPDASRVVRTFQVEELTEEDLADVILRPTSQEPVDGSEEVPHDEYRFQYEQGVAEHIAADAVRLGRANQEAALPLVHVVCARLYELVRARSEPVVRVADLKAIGGVEKGLSKYLTLLVKNLATGRDRKALWKLLHELVVHQADGAAASKLIFEDDIAVDWAGNAPVDSIISAAASDDTRLLQVNYLNVGGREGQYVTLGSDALAPVVAQQTDEAAKRSHGWSKFADALWITLPLLVLLSVFSWARLRSVHNQLEKETEEHQKAQAELEVVGDELQSRIWPAYLGQLRLAEQAIQTGEISQARKALLALKPVSAGEGDYRGFDWHYLWQQMHLDQATLKGHGDTVSSVALTSDGGLLATTSPDGTVRLWDVYAGRELAKLELKDKNTLASGHCVAFSPDGSFLAAGADDGVIRLWKVQRTGLGSPSNAANFLASLIPHEGGFTSPLLNIAARGGTPDSVKIHAELSDHKGTVFALAFSPDGKTLASAGKDSVIRLWDIATSKPQTLKEHEGEVFALAYSPDGKTLASAGADKKIRIWDVSKWTKTATLDGHPQAVVALAWTADGKTLASGGAQDVHQLETGVVKLWNAANWKKPKTPTFQVGSVFALAFADDGKTLVTASKNNMVQFWDVASAKEKSPLRGHLGWVRSLAVARGGAVVASGSYDHTAKVWLPGEAAKRDLLKASTEPVCAVAFSPDDRWIATGSGNGTVKLWNVTTAKEHTTLKAHKGAVLTLAWNASGKSLATGGADGKLKLWDMDPAPDKFAKEVDSADAHKKDLTCLQWATEGKSLATGSLDGSVKVWNLTDGKFAKEPISIVTGNDVLCLVLRNELDFLATGHADGKTRLWDSTNGKPFPVSKVSKNVISGQAGAITGISLLYFEKRKLARLITAGADQSIRYWNIGAGQEEQIVRGHSGAITCLNLGPRPEYSMITGGADQALLLWDPEIMQLRSTFTPGVGAIRAVAVSNNGRVIAAAGQDGSVRLYRAGKPEESKK